MLDSTKIRQLNDEFRSTWVGGTILITRGIRNLAELHLLVEEVRRYNSFDGDSDPHLEHDFGSILFQERQIFWKIDYYAPDMLHGSEDPSNPAITRRVMTLMLAEEY